jgi:hypothetical protein
VTSLAVPPLGKGAREEPATGRYAWRVAASGRHCRARTGGMKGSHGCRRPAVAELNRGRTERKAGLARWRDAWWPYCIEDLLAYNRAVIDGAVWWLGVDADGHNVAGYWRKEGGGQ